MDNTIACTYCGKPSNLVSGSVLYPHLLHIYDNMYYYCKSCNAWTPRNNKTGKPSGTFANKELRAIRAKAHEAFDPFWEVTRERSKAYAWLARQLKIPFRLCHIGMFDIETCQKVIDICKRERQYKREAEEKAKKRSEKLARRAEKRRLKAEK